MAYFSYIYVDLSQNIFLLPDLEIAVTYFAFKFNIKRMLMYVIIMSLFTPRAKENHKLKVQIHNFFGGLKMSK